MDAADCPSRRRREKPRAASEASRPRTLAAAIWRSSAASSICLAWITAWAAWRIAVMFDWMAPRSAWSGRSGRSGRPLWRPLEPRWPRRLGPATPPTTYVHPSDHSRSLVERLE